MDERPGGSVPRDREARSAAVTARDALLAEFHRHGQRAATLYLSEGQEPCVGLPFGGAVTPLPGWESQPLAREALRALLIELVSQQRWEEFERRQALQTVCAAPGPGSTRVQVHVYEQLGGLGATLRLLPERPPGVVEQRLPAPLLTLVEERGGVLVVAGPAGSGKSTTLATLVGHICQTSARHVVTIESPVLYQHEGGRAAVVQREVGSDVHSLREALQRVAAQDADVLVVDPLPLEDPALIPELLHLAETGPLVILSVRAPHCGRAIEQLATGFPMAERRQGRQALGRALRAVVAQRLCHTVEGEVAVAYEVLLGGPELGAALLDGSPRATAAYLLGGRHRGMQTLDDSLAGHVEAGLISLEEARRLAQDSERFAAAPVR